MKFLSVSNVWGIVTLAPQCSATASLCELGLGFEVHLQRSAYPAPPVELCDEEGNPLAVEVIGNAFLSLDRSDPGLFLNIKARDLGLYLPHPLH